MQRGHKQIIKLDFKKSFQKKENCEKMKKITIKREKKLEEHYILGIKVKVIESKIIRKTL